MNALDQNHGNFLLQLARKNIAHQIANSPPWLPDREQVDKRLLERQACFVTLADQGQLRGCIGSLEPMEALLDNVARNARAAANADPRFPPVTATELDYLQIEISVLAPPSPVFFNDEQTLLTALRPYVDGIILHTPNGGRATFLPSVWEQLPDPKVFLRHLKEKAGLPADYWHKSIRIERYQVQHFEEQL